MKDPSLPLQKAVHDTLAADTAVAALVAARIYDRVPPAPTFPYVHIGDDHIVSDADQCHDACTAYATVHVFSQAVGKTEAKAIMATVCHALDVLLAVSGFGVITHAVDDGPRHMTDPDGLTSHSVVTFVYRLAPTS
jgi:hypothetical protein